MLEREALIKSIILLEEEMFVQVNAGKQDPAWCQQALGTFRQMRQMSHSVLSAETLQSYLQDLQTAIAEGRNLVLEKYARMDNIWPRTSAHQYIDFIAVTESNWLQQLRAEYPHLLGQQEKFLNYAISEWETYSAQTLELYYQDLLMAQLAGINLVRKRYENLYKSLGFANLKEVEKLAKKNLALATAKVQEG